MALKQEDQVHIYDQVESEPIEVNELYGIDPIEPIDSIISEGSDGNIDNQDLEVTPNHYTHTSGSVFDLLFESAYFESASNPIYKASTMDDRSFSRMRKKRNILNLYKFVINDR